MAPAFYTREGELLAPTELTRGPWDPGAQHAGPPAALLARALERCEPRPGLQIGRVTVEILGPSPRSPCRHRWRAPDAAWSCSRRRCRGRRAS